MPHRGPGRYTTADRGIPSSSALIICPRCRRSPATMAPATCCAADPRSSAASCVQAVTSTHAMTWRPSGMRLEQSFEVAAPIDQVWRALVDVEHVAPCLPGAAVTGRNEDGSYAGTFSVRIGPTSASYAGKLVMEAVDESTHTATLYAAGNDRRGQGGAKATIISTVSPSPAGGARVSVNTEYHITGRLA